MDHNKGHNISGYDEFRSWLVSCGYIQNTVRIYTERLRTMANWLEAETGEVLECKNVRLDTFTRFMRDTDREHEREPGWCSALNAYGRWCEDMGSTTPPVWPGWDIPRKKQRFISVDEHNAIRAWLLDQKVSTSGVYKTMTGIGAFARWYYLTKGTMLRADRKLDGVMVVYERHLWGKRRPPHQRKLPSGGTINNYLRGARMYINWASTQNVAEDDS
ncbi:MAG: hypothetical protein ACERKX_12090 [Anaerolineales bacterium]